MLYTLNVAMAFAFLSSLYGDFMQVSLIILLFNLLLTAVYLFLECFFIFGVQFFTSNNRKMHTFNLLIVKGDTLRLLIVKCTINNRMLQQIYLLIVDTVLLSTPKLHSTGRHHEKNLHTQELHLTELALK